MQPAPEVTRAIQGGNAVKTFVILLYAVPTVAFFTLPLLNILYQSSKAKRAAKAKEEERRRAAELKRIAQYSKRAAIKKTAGVKKARKEKPAGSTEKRKPGRPQKNPPTQRAANIPAKAAATPIIAPPGLPTNCTPEQFATWIK